MKNRFVSHLSQNNTFVVLTIRLLIVLLLLSISRMSLYFMNPGIFSGASFTEILMVYINGLRFDISVLSILGSLFILANTFPLRSRKNRIFQKIINTLTLILFSIAIYANLADAIYYRFTMKRMTFDIFNYLSADTGLNEMATQFLIDYWYVIACTIVMIILLVYFFTRIKFNKKIESSGWRFYVLNSFIFLLSATIIVIGIRGGIGKNRLKPLNIVDAGLYAPPALTSLVLNTPFTIIKSYGQIGMQMKNDFSQDELEKIFNPIHAYQPLENVPENIKNVMVIILESFSIEHFGYFNNNIGYTPFLDSLFSEGLVFSATANGKRSIEGIPAILSSIPTLSNESFLMGPYAANQIEGLAGTLAKHDYTTAFFHGGKNGTMNLDAYAWASGFQSYFGLNEYQNKNDFDGFWGIWDEIYLKYAAGMIDDMRQPFLSAVFTLSSHHPYQVPEKYKDSLPSGPLKIQQSIAYTDLALRRFFEEIKTKEWFNNTLFVITADHTSEAALPEFKNSFGQFRIPLAFYCSGDSVLKTRSEKLPVQQTDVFPSVLHYLGIMDTILCFGNSIFDPDHFPFAINYSNLKTQILDSEYLLQIQDDKVQAVYNYNDDLLLKNNLKDEVDVSQLVRFQRAFSQQYNNRMIQNKLKSNSNK